MREAQFEIAGQHAFDIRHRTLGRLDAATELVLLARGVDDAAQRAAERKVHAHDAGGADRDGFFSARAPPACRPLRRVPPGQQHQGPPMPLRAPFARLRLVAQSSLEACADLLSRIGVLATPTKRWMPTLRSGYPEVSSTAFATHPPDLPPRLLMVMDFAVIGPLVQAGRPRIWFLFVRSWFCSTLPSDLASRRRPCASLTLHHHQVG